MGYGLFLLLKYNRDCPSLHLAVTLLGGGGLVPTPHSGFCLIETVKFYGSIVAEGEHSIPGAIQMEYLSMSKNLECFFILIDWFQLAINLLECAPL